MSTSSQDSINLWDQMWSKVCSIIGADEKFQLIYPFMDWTWPVPSPGYIDKTAYSVVGQIPKWSAVGKYTPSADDFYSNYKSLIANCPQLTETPEQKQQLKKVQDQINTAQGQLTADTSAKNTAWVAAQNVPSGVPPPEYNDWMQTSGWQGRLDTDRIALDKANETKAAIAEQQNPEYKAAIEAAALPTDPYKPKPGFAKCNINGQDQWRANYIISDGQDWIAQLTDGGGTPLLIELDSSKAQHSMEKSWAGGAADYGGFISFYANGSWEEVKLNESGSNLTISIKIEAVTQVPVRADVWYNSGYLSVLAKQGKWNSPFTTKAEKGKSPVKDESPVFGQGGILPLAITSMVAGYQISFSINLSTQDYERHESKFKATGGIRIGPFRFGGVGYDTSSESWKRETNGTSFSGSSTAKYPFLIGFALDEPGLN